MSERARRRPIALVIGIVAVLVLGLGAGWATATVFTPPKDVLSSAKYATVKVSKGTIGSSIALNTVAEWTPVPVGTNRAAGIVTSAAFVSGDVAQAGTVLYSVGLRPVVIAQGLIPSFRTLTVGLVGPDVGQLQSLLAKLGLYRGRVTDSFTASTKSAVVSWQKRLGMSPDGAVSEGDVIYVPALPARIAVQADVIKVGSTLGGSELVVSTLPAQPNFTMPVTSQQAVMAPNGTSVEITAPNGSRWEAVVRSSISDDKSGTTLLLDGANANSSICADTCASVPVSGQTLLSSKLIITPTVSGLTIPTSALKSDAKGGISVIKSDGRPVAVKVIGSARGISVIEGVPEGTRLRIPADANR